MVNVGLGCCAVECYGKSSFSYTEIDDTGTPVTVQQSLSILPFFKGLSSSSQVGLQRDARCQTFQQGEVIIHKGQAVGGAYIALAGELRIYTLDANGYEKPIYSLQSGEVCVFSLNCVFKQVVYPAWVTIDSKEADVLAIPASHFRALYESEPVVRDYVLDSMSQQIFDLMSSVEEVAVHDIGYRINSFLIRLCPSDQVLTIGHQEIATRLGTAREVVSRHLKALEKAELIRLSRMKITILQPQALAAIPPKNAV